MPYKDPEKERERIRRRLGTESHKEYMRQYSKRRRLTTHAKQRQAVADKKFRKNNREKFNTYQREWLRQHKVTNPEKALQAAIAKRSRNMKGVVIDRLPPENCESCGKPFISFATSRQRVPQADHCHKANHFRGWLCSGCNSSLGFAGDDRATLQLLINYLDRTEIWR